MGQLLSTGEKKYSKGDFYKLACLFYLMFGAILFIISPLLFLIVIGLTSPFFPAHARLLFGPLVLIVAITFYSTLEPFSDLAEYLNVYHQINNGTINIFGYSRFGYGIEFLILLIMKVVGYLSNGNDEAFLLAIYSIILSYLYFICNSLKNKYSLFLFCSVFLSLGMLESLSYFLRQNLSVVLFLYGLVCAKRRSTRWFYFLLSIFSHISGFINIFVYLFAIFYKKRINNLQRIMKVVCIAGGVTISLFFVMQLSTIGQSLLEKAIYVINSKQYSTLPVPYIIMTSINILIIAFLFRDNKDINVVFYYLFLKEVLFFYFTLPFPAVPNRLGMLVFSYSTIFGYYTLSYMGSGKRKLYITLMVICNLMAFNYAMYNISLKANNYSFYNNQPFSYNIYNVFSNLYESLNNGVTYIDNGNN